VGQFVMHKRNFSQMSFLAAPEAHIWVQSGIKPEFIYHWVTADC